MINIESLSVPIGFIHGRRNTENFYFVEKGGLSKINRSNNNQIESNKFTSSNKFAYAIHPFLEEICRIDLFINRYYGREISKEYCIDFYDFNTLTTTRTHEISSYGIKSLAYSLDGKFLILGELHRCTIITADTLEPYHTFRSHKTFVTRIVQSPNLMYLFSGDKEGIIKSYNFEKKSEIRALIEPNAKKIAKMIISQDNEFLVVLHKSFMVNIWSIAKMIKVGSMILDKVLDIQFPKQSSYMFCLYEQKIICINFPSLSACFEIAFTGLAKKFSISADSKEIAVILDNQIEIIKNPLFNETISIYGDLKLFNNFYQYVGKLCSGKLDKYESFANNWVIEPFHINVMHLYAYCNKFDFLQSCIKDNTGFFMSKSNFTPLDVCLEMNLEKGIDFFYSEIKKKAKINPMYLSLLESTTNRLCRHAYQNSSQFVDLLLHRSIDTTL